jgi:hypothetical protein
MGKFLIVIPAKPAPAGLAGIRFYYLPLRNWTPAFAGVTEFSV